MKALGPKEAQLRDLKASRVAPPERRKAVAKKIVADTAPKATVPDTVQEASLPVTVEATKSETSKAKAETKPEPTAKPKATVKQESVMQTKTATTTPRRTAKEAAANLRAAKAKAAPRKAAADKTASKTSAKANARKPVGDKQPQGMAEKIGKLASRPQGASRAELIELSGWSAQAWKWYFVNSKDNGFCQRFGYKLDVIEGKDGETRYKITKK